jgi:uncharacterized membrane protein YdjX (TVP38/TMEM64 family)/rhodanese-related sulfurtransferase
MSLQRVWSRLLLAALLAAAIGWAIAHRQDFSVGAIEAGVGGLGAWAPLAFIIVFAVATVLFLPGSILALSGGALFGPLWGVLYNLLGATAGATLAFLVARYLASGWVTRKAGGRLQRVIEGVEAEGWRFVAFVRLVPIFPFNLLNYALGLTRIRLFDYVLASLVCMAPGTVAYTYLEYAGRETVAGGEALKQKGLIALGLLSFAAFLPRVVRRFRSTSFKWVDAGWLRSRVATGEAPVIVDVRGRDEFVGDLGHLEGAGNIPITEFPGRIGELDAFRTRKIVLVCRTQMRSAKAAAALTKAGFRDVAVLRGGMLEWSRQGLPVDQG